MSFKLNAKQLLLTFPKCTLTKEKVLEGLSAIKEIDKYTISEEQHSDGSPHVHALIILREKLHTTNARYFDLGVWHANIKILQRKKDVEQADRYVRKDGKFITNFPEAKSKRTQLAERLLESGQINSKFIRENPEVIFLNHSSISSWLSYLAPKFEGEPPKLKKRHIWVYGASNCGKTHWLRAYLSLSEETCEIPGNNDFREANLQTTVMYCDEYKGSLTVQQLNRLCDGCTQLNVKGGSTRIAYPTIIICSNFSIRDCYPKVDDNIYITLVNRFNEYMLPINCPPLPKSIINY